MNEQNSVGGVTPLVPVEPPVQSDLSYYLATVLEARWLIGGVAIAALCCGVCYALLATPIYVSNALIQVEEKSRGIMGLEQLSESLASPSDAETEIEIIRSRTLLASVVEQRRLDLWVWPHTFPFIGAGIARRHTGPELNRPLLGLASYAWGGERIRVDRIEMPQGLFGHPVALVAGVNGHYQLFVEDQRILEGEVGKVARGTISEGEVELFVSELYARPGTRFGVVREDPDDVIDRLQRSLGIREKGRKTGILSLSLEGPNPVQLAAVLDGVATAYVRQNVERRSEEARKTLEFVNGQLPAVKSSLSASEVALNDYRSRKGSIDLSLEAKGALDRLIELEKAIAETDIQYAEMRLRYTDAHPLVQAVKKKQTKLQSERQLANTQIRKLPEEEMESMRLLRDVNVGSELYVLLLNKAQELKVLSEGTVGNVRIIDHARKPRRPSHPQIPRTAVLSLALGVVLGVVAAFARKALHRGVEDPDEVERALGIPVYATVPHSERQFELARSIAHHKGGFLALARADPNDLSVESLRSLRTTLQFALTDAENNIIAIGGPSPGVGKSFICANLAYVLADAGRRLLLIDGDMRNGGLHRSFGVPRGPGLSEVISGTVPVEQALHRDPEGKLDFLPGGSIPPNPSELLMSPRFQAMLVTASKAYDLVILDCPPILAVTDAAILARHAGVNLFVLRAGQHPIREVSLGAKRMAQNGVRLQGMILNDVRRVVGGAYGQFGYAYQYAYGDSSRGRGGRWKRIASGSLRRRG